MNSKSNRKKIDIHSIRFRLWAFFLLFSLIILGLIWCLQILFLNTYYEEMKANETRKIASSIRETYKTSGYDLESLSSTIANLSNANDITIMVIDSNGEYVMTSFDINFLTVRRDLTSQYANDMATLYVMLESSGHSSVTQTSSNRRSKERTLEYAVYLPDENGENNYIMYIFSPLYPVKSTVNILQNQLMYISIIAIFLAFVMALFLSDHIARPIKDITQSAAEMGKGNYGVQFRGGQFTEITELADTLTRAEHELEKTDMYQKDLIANVSHDLRTPLTMIKSYAEMIRDLSGDNPVKRASHLAVIIEETDRLNSLVDDMLNLSRMQSKKIVLDLVPFDFIHTARSIVASYDILSESDGYKFELNCDEGPFIVHADEPKIKQVMTNLINNAVKYCGEDQVIIIDVRKSGRKVRFSVADHGQGIASDELTHVWERYYKSSTNHVRSTEGSGLGLSIVKEILNLHKASFGVESELGKGSTFWFELPQMKAKKPNADGPTLKLT